MGIILLYWWAIFLCSFGGHFFALLVGIFLWSFGNHFSCALLVGNILLCSTSSAGGQCLLTIGPRAWSHRSRRLLCQDDNRWIEVCLLCLGGFKVWSGVLNWNTPNCNWYRLMQVSRPGYGATYQQEQIIICCCIQSHYSALLQLLRQHWKLLQTYFNRDRYPWFHRPWRMLESD